MAKRRKAIAGLLTPIISYVALRFGLELSDEAAAGIASVLTGVVVERVRNL